VRTALALLVAVCAALLTASSASATLAERLTRALTSPGVSWSKTGALALDIQNGRKLYSRNASLSLRPASNAKLTVALAALDRLGPGNRIPTLVRGEGRREGGTWHGRLVLKGFGDPTLSSGDLATLAARVRASGISRITGAIEGDESYWDTRRVVSGWKASFYKEECPPLSALTVDRAKVGSRVVSDPAFAAARAFRGALVAAGVRVDGWARKGVADNGSVGVARVVSGTMRRLVLRMNRVSDNFIAESLLKVLGARIRGNGTSAAGARIVTETLAARGVPLRGVRIVDGSGLSRYDRLTARAIAALLVSAWSDRTIRRPFFESLPLAGVEGTLEDRLESAPAYRSVRAKTGTTKHASALSGYVRRRIVFSVLQNGSPIPFWHARRAQDRFAQVLAGTL
jgi:D-alanyl-D-alanine carboxypeptidase/D-alanyl-D-alanine-endopeptidase (penicillin-binding protein 4)